MKEVLVCDTSGLLAALDRADPDHAACVAVLERHDAPLLLSPLVLAELDHLVRSRLGAEAARTVADDVAAGAYELATLSPADIAACVDIDCVYGELGLGLPTPPWSSWPPGWRPSRCSPSTSGTSAPSDRCRAMPFGCCPPTPDRHEDHDAWFRTKR